MHVCACARLVLPCTDFSTEQLAMGHASPLQSQAKFFRCAQAEFLTCLSTLLAVTSHNTVGGSCGYKLTKTFTGTGVSAPHAALPTVCRVSGKKGDLKQVCSTAE